MFGVTVIVVVSLDVSVVVIKVVSRPVIGAVEVVSFELFVRAVVALISLVVRSVAVEVLLSFSVVE